MEGIDFDEVAIEGDSDACSTDFRGVGAIGAFLTAGVTCSSQFSIGVSNSENYRSVDMNCKAITARANAMCCGAASKRMRSRNACMRTTRDFYWQASQPGSSMAQNLISVAGSAGMSTATANEDFASLLPETETALS